MTAPFFYEGTLKSKQIATVGVFGVPVASATNDHGIGSLIRDELTGTIYEYVKFTGAIAANEVMSSLSADGTVVGQCSAAAAGCAARRGVSFYAANTNEYGFIAVHGPAYVKYSGTGYVLGDHIGPDVAAAGKVIEASVSNGPTQAEMVLAANLMGYALEAEAATVASLLKIFIQHCV